MRRDYVEGCDTSPVGFLEGVFVEEGHRGAGYGRRLVEAVRQWAGSKGCTELASNARLDNGDSHKFHSAIGFAETERVVFFKRSI